MYDNSLELYHKTVNLFNKQRQKDGATEHIDRRISDFGGIYTV